MATYTTDKNKKTKDSDKNKKIKTVEPQGIPTITSQFFARITTINPETVPAMQSNIHVADAINNIIRQVFTQPPEIWVTDPDGETDETLTAEAKSEFERLHCYDLMQESLIDRWQWGPFVHSDGIDKKDGKFFITEIRHLPCSTFSTMPAGGGNFSIPNPLTPGIAINQDGDVEVWQTDPFTGYHQKLDNIKIETAHGTPKPSGAAYLYPVYHAIAQIDYASKAEIQQLARIGAPPLLPKAKDDIDQDLYKKLNQWFAEFLRKWGKDTSALLPPGIEFPNLNIREGTVAERFIAERINWIRNYTNPVSDLQQNHSGIGTSDSGRMEIWTAYIASEQDACEQWIINLFNWILEANGYEGFKTHIKLKRPSVDKANLRLQYLKQAYDSKIITIRELRDNMTDIIDLPEWTPELEIELRNQYPQSTASSLFGNVSNPKKEDIQTVGYDTPQIRAMQKMVKQVDRMDATAEDAILKIMNYNQDK